MLSSSFESARFVSRTRPVPGAWQVYCNLYQLRQGCGKTSPWISSPICLPLTASLLSWSWSTGSPRGCISELYPQGSQPSKLPRYSSISSASTMVSLEASFLIGIPYFLVPSGENCFDSAALVFGSARRIIHNQTARLR